MVNVEFRNANVNEACPPAPWLHITDDAPLVSCRDFAQWASRRPTTFWQWIKAEFSLGNEPTPVVCIPPGARLRLMGIPETLKNQVSGVLCQDVVFYAAFGRNQPAPRCSVVCKRSHRSPAASARRAEAESTLAFLTGGSHAESRKTRNPAGRVKR